MEYRVVSIANSNKELIDRLITNMLSENARLVFGYTRSEFDSIVEYDLLNILAFYYSRMDAKQKRTIEDYLPKIGPYDHIEDWNDLISNWEGNIYVPLACRLVERLGDTRITRIIYETLFSYCCELTNTNWDKGNSYSNYLVILNAAHFSAIAEALHLNNSYRLCLNEFYSEESYDDFVEYLYKDHQDDPDWDVDIDIDAVDDLIEEYKSISLSPAEEGDYNAAISFVNELRHSHQRETPDPGDREGIDLIVLKTGIKEFKVSDIHGFQCHFCQARKSEDEYIIVYQKDTRINDIIDDTEAWSGFQKTLYMEDIRNDHSTAMVYIIYILDDDSDNIPIQTIESNKTYGRKYVFTENEAITFINGIVRTSYEEVENSSPVQEWDRILREEHLTGCLTEAYAAKKVDAYLSGQRFDADYVMDDDYAFMTHSVVPQIKWVKSLDTSGFRDFCFDDKVMEFGQINLFYGANGSGKTSVLEAVEYALTAEVRRVKDFKVKLPTDSYPRLYVYDREAGVHTFTPGFAKKNKKEIERVWYGVPIGRTKSNLNENFNRFNAFDSEAAYKFIHESDNSEDSFASMFGNLIFGESVVDHEKKWQRFKKAFDEKYTELRETLSDARYWVQVYEESLSQKSDTAKSEDIERGIVELKLIILDRLPKVSSDRYPKIMEELSLVRKYVDILGSQQLIGKTFTQVAEDVTRIKASNLRYVKEKKEKSDEITRLTEANGGLKKNIFDEQEKEEEIQERIDRVNEDIRNWTIVQNVLSHVDTIRLVNELLDELTEIDRELYYISKIEQRTAIVNFLKSGQYIPVSDAERRSYEEQLTKAKSERLELEQRYTEAKKAFGEKEQNAIELRKIGKTLLTDSKCPLCGHEYESMQQLLDIIDSAVVVDENIDTLILELEALSKRIMELEKLLDREKLIEKAKAELQRIADSVPMVKFYGSDYGKLYDYLISKVDKEKRKAEIVEQQAALDAQGFSLKNINACKAYKTTDATYLEYEKFGKGTYSEYLSGRLTRLQLELDAAHATIERYRKQIQQNEQKEELLRNDIRRLDSQLEALDMDDNRVIEQALENLKTKFTLQDDMVLSAWIAKYHSVYDQCELEVERLESQDSITFEKQQLVEYKSIIKRVEPQVVRCANAVRAFEQMPSLSSFVEGEIKKRIVKISDLFTRMHHSGDFVRLGVDSDGLYAVRSINDEVIRLYEMSTGQRATIAMAVMFALHLAAGSSPQFLLLDEPLATMDDVQVENVLQILYEFANEGTQIFFTTANGIMIDLFKKRFKNTDFDYKEYQFIKRLNRPSQINETSINDARTIEELTLDDLTLDFSQFAEIRAILRRNQEKLVTKEEWEVLDGQKPTSQNGKDETVQEETSDQEDNFFAQLTPDERKLLILLLLDEGRTAASLKNSLILYPNFKMMFETINEKAVDFFGETVVENNDELPWIGSDYREELRSQYEIFNRK